MNNVTFAKFVCASFDHTTAMFMAEDTSASCVMFDRKQTASAIATQQ